MTRKHYNAMAAALRTMPLLPGEWRVHATITRLIADAYEEENPRFDYVRFIKASRPVALSVTAELKWRDGTAR